MTTGGDRDSDHELLACLRKGEKGAYETLFMRHYGAMYGVLYGLTGSREVAEDVAQETFLALYNEPPALDEGRALVAWLCRVALNKAHNAMRGAQRAYAREERVARLGSETSLPEEPEEHLLRAEEHTRVRDALAQLSERQGKVLLLRSAGLTYAEVADLLGVAPGSVGTLLARAERAFMEAYRKVEATSLARAQEVRLRTEGMK